MNKIALLGLLAVVPVFARSLRNRLRSSQSP